MSKVIYYNQAKALSSELGFDVSALKSRWRNSNKAFWEAKVKLYKKDIKNRRNNYNRTLQVSKKFNQPLRIPNRLSGTSNKTWIKEVRRIRMTNVRKLTKSEKELLKRKQTTKDTEKTKRKLRIERLRNENEEKKIVENDSRTFNELIRRNKFQDTFNIIVGNNKKLSDIQMNRLWNKIVSDGRYTMSIKLKNDRTPKVLMVNNSSKAFITNVLTTGGMFQITSSFGFGSDTSLSIDINKVQSITLNKITPSRIIENRDGRFFPYLNTTEVPLSEYQIFNQKEAYNEKLIKKREHCLIHTLIKAGIKKTIVNNIKMSYVSGVNIRKKDLHIISNIIKRDINLKTLNGLKTKTQKIECSLLKDKPEPIQIALYQNHYFLFEDTKYTKFSITHYDELKDEEDFHNIYKIIKNKKGGKDYYIRDETKSKINSLLLVHKFLKADKFGKLDLIKFEETSTHKDLREHIYLDNMENEQTEMKEKTYTPEKLEIKSFNGLEEFNRNDLDREHKEFLKEMDWNGPEETTEEKLKCHSHEQDEYIKKYEKAIKQKEKQIVKENTFVYYADCESYVNDIKENHKLQLLGVVNDYTDCVDIYSVMDERYKNSSISNEQQVVNHFLNTITNNGNNNALCYYHNLKYDYHLLEPYLNIKQRCEKDNQLFNIICKYKGKEVELRDSIKIIPFSLSKFGEEFNLPKEIRKKEAIAYVYYTKENDNKIITTSEYTKLLSNDEKVIFNNQIKLEPSYNPKNSEFDNEPTFNPMSYYKEYLRLDCLVLKKGIQKFDTLIKEITEGKMDVYDCLTISSLTDQYMVKEGAYDGVYQVQGNLRAYISKAVYGGRVSVNKKYKKKIIEGKIADYDGVSLYPSAIARLCDEGGLAIGKAKRLREHQFNQWKCFNYSVLTVKINKVNKTQQMPFITYRDDEAKSLSYLNELPKCPITGESKPIIIDSTTLEDFINFHKIEYEILDGVYWDSGVNKLMGNVIKKLFKSRLKYKKTNKALANVIKLMLNSSYGKTIMKKTKSEKVIVNTVSKKFNKETSKWENVEKTNFQNYIYNNFHTIKGYRRLNENCYEIERIKADNSFNRGHIGCSILSMSKRIMNEVFDIANDNKLPIYYTDTDSLHCNWDDVKILEHKYEERYNKVLNGKELGQFHTDFNLDNAVSDIYATKSIFLGKKSYLDCLESTDKNGNKITGFHTRLKGITEAGLKCESKKYNDSYLGLYTDLSNGIEKSIVLNPFDKDDNKQKVLFKFKDGKVSTKEEFIRKIKF